MQTHHARLRVAIGFLTLSLPLSLALPAAYSQEKPKSQQAKSFEKEIKITVKLNYLLFLPEGYESGDKKWPLILFLHGAGESGSDVQRVKATGLPKLLDTKTDLPFVVVSPQSPRGGWNADTLNALLDDVLARYKIDPDRVYLTGLSMGGFGTWELGTAHPERFAAIAPICGGGTPAQRRPLERRARLGIPWRQGYGRAHRPNRGHDQGHESCRHGAQVHDLPRSQSRFVDRDLQQPRAL